MKKARAPLVIVALAASTLSSTARAQNVSIIGQAPADGDQFTDFDGPNSGAAAGAGTAISGISNAGTIVGSTTDNAGNLTNFTANPLASTTAHLLSRCS